MNTILPFIKSSIILLLFLPISILKGQSDEIISNVEVNKIVFRKWDSYIKQKLKYTYKNSTPPHYFLKGLSRHADKNNDNIITDSEMYNYLSKNVARQARKIGREQNPQLFGINKDRILLKY
tara:strand:- start:427 stop:792 length:366 start_codon:yes stop_codon:yes gene_type:complete